jgi:nucleotide-binding universal stress UspA family protein
MPLQDILLHIDSYPEPTPPEAIDQAIAFCKSIDSKLSGLAVQIDIRVPNNWLAEALVGISKLAEAEEARSRSACQVSLAIFEQKAKAAGVLGQTLIGKAELRLAGPYVARRARTRDLCLVAIVDRPDDQRTVAEDVIFESGRPALVFRPGAADLPVGGPKVVAIAWDGSRCAARAVADALPILAKAREVRVFTAVHEKPAAVSGLGAELLRHLRTCGIEASAQEVDARHKPIGAVLDTYLESSGADLLVMGAYGHSKMREFILGGATEHMLNHLRVPVFLSH